MVVEQKSNIPINEDGYISLKVDDILNAENEYFGWRDSDGMWLGHTFKFIPDLILN